MENVLRGRFMFHNDAFRLQWDPFTDRALNKHFNYRSKHLKLRDKQKPEHVLSDLDTGWMDKTNLLKKNEDTTRSLVLRIQGIRDMLIVTVQSALFSITLRDNFCSYLLFSASSHRS